MIDLEELELEVLGRLDQLTVEDKPVFATVTGHTGPAATRGLAIARHARSPAAVMVVNGRGLPTAGADLGMIEFSVLISVKSFGGNRALRLGDGCSLGAYRILSLTTEALNGAVLLSGDRLQLRRERAIHGSTESIVYDQKYRVEPPGTPEHTAPDGSDTQAATPPKPR
jgi:hypothetical protein